VCGGAQQQCPFPYRGISFDEYVQGFVGSNVEPCEFGGFFGFIDNEGSCFVPKWFAQSEATKKTSLSEHGQGFQYEDLSVGDFVVHQDCGVGRFRGLKTTYDENDNADEALVIEYADGGLVSLDINHLHKLSFYAKAEDGIVLIDSLNKRGLWDKKKRKAKKQADEVVESLLSAYALRKKLSRPPLSVDMQLEEMFLKQFPFDETVDQKRVWKEISKNLSSPNPMDRLLCGDVGFGKTEIAIRVAFRAALHGKRVLVLSPTTILSKQLEVAFHERLNVFGIKVVSVSRFKTKKEVENIKSLWAEGKIDVLVGTHAVLYDQIYLNRVGLLIVDEEHRFGVKQKESIRSLKHTIDVLSMSATPIPRTLNLALSGIRDISTLTTPPMSRRPIETQVCFYNEALIKKAILAEKQRGGQVFFVHNDVKTLPNYQQFLSKVLTNIRVGVVHGQLPGRQVEGVMQNFLDKKVDVLLCTSIIETGIDVANANTVIVNNAHNFGLSQLYQIRGRVGRSSSQAYAYLLIPEGKNLKRGAFRRLKAIEENTHLGAGYNISNMDLEIRGAGAVFGYRQSGGVGSVGFELYSVYIKEALTKLDQQEVLLSPQDVVVKMFSSAVIPEDYLPSTNLRIQFYRRINSLENKEGLILIQKEMENRMGPVPLPLNNLFKVWEIKCLGAKLGVLAIEKSGDIISILFEKTFVEPQLDTIFKLLPDFSTSTGWDYQFKPKTDEGFVIIFRTNNRDISSTVITFLNKLGTIFKS
jgi:transcription-repair coupling factor (superfamily II helicase)